MGQGSSAYHIGSRTLAIVYQELTTVEADVLVSSDDNYLSMGGGVSARLVEIGGPSVRDHARKFVPPVAQRPARQGDVIVTTAGALDARYLFHAVTIDQDLGKGPTESIIEEATARCMRLAEALGATSIAFPALGTGVGSFSFQVAAELMVRAITTALDSSTTVERVTIALFARRGVSQPELNEFYEHAVGQIALWQQSKRLGQSLNDLEGLEGLPQTDADSLRTLHAEIQAAEDHLAGTAPTAEEIEPGERARSFADLGRRVVVKLSELSGPTELPQDQATRQTTVRAELEGLRFEHNAWRLLLTKLETDRALVGDGGPESARRIAEVTRNLNDVDTRSVDAEHRLEQLA